MINPPKYAPPTRLYLAALVLVQQLVEHCGRPRPDTGPAHEDRDRGDVPGWVMVTVMTAIVVVALLAIFPDAVTGAVSSAFKSVTKGLGN